MYFSIIIFGSVESLSEAVSASGPSTIVYDTSIGLLGVFAGIVAFLGVVIFSITPGDTAFLSSRLIMA